MSLPSPARHGTGLIDRLLPWLVCLLGTFIYHRYTILSGFDVVQADDGDSRFIAFILEHWNAALSGREDWRSPPIFYPVRGTLAYSDMLLGMGLPHALLRHAGLGVFMAMNVQLILLTALAFASCHVFLRRGLRFGVPACCAGAYFFAFGWPRFAQLVHEQLQFDAPLPLMALLALRFLRDGSAMTRGRAFLTLVSLALLAALLLTTASYYALFFALALTLAVLLCMLAPDARRLVLAAVCRHGGPLAATAALLAVLLVPVARLYAPVMHDSGGRSWAEVLPFLPHPVDFFWMGRENYLWGWLFDRFPGRADLNWPELRLGTGLAASALWGWGILWAARFAWGSATGRRALPAAGDGAACVVILTGAALQLSMLMLPHHLTFWRVIYELFPGLSGVRAVSRLQLVAMLGMAVAIALFTERLSAPNQPGRWRRPALAGLLFLGAAEQAGTVYRYSGGQAEALARHVAGAVPAGCDAFYVVAPPGILPPPPVITAESNFDSLAYLQANPDVAKGWSGTAWQHYVQFGRAEHRYLDAADAERHQQLNFSYAYTVPLAAVLAGKPAVNGLSGWEPPGYHLGDFFAADDSAGLTVWLAGHGLPAGSVCVLKIALDPSELSQWGR